MPICGRVRGENMYSWCAREPMDTCHIYRDHTPLKSLKQLGFLSPANPSWAVSLGEIFLLLKKWKLSMHATIKTVTKDVSLDKHWTQNNSDSSFKYQN